MDLVDKLRLWGIAHGAARDAERQAAQQQGADALHRQARQLRERADRLHREIYRELGSRPERQAHASR
jgi:acyl-CoA reductase-like NAD-dependent aldehyde dehydrogenase